MPSGRSAKHSSSTSSSQEEMEKSSLQAIMAKLNEIEKRIVNIEEKVSGIESSFEYHVEVVEQLKSDVKQINDVLPVIQSRTEEQQLLTQQKTIEIQGIPSHSDESGIDIVNAIAKKVGVKLTSDNIDLVYRTRNKKSLIVKFLQTHRRNDFYKKFKKAAKESRVTTADIGYKDSNNIFVNEHLTFEQRKLFYQARMFKMKNDYKHVWTANHRIYLRLTQDSPQIPIKSIEDLNALENK